MVCEIDRNYLKTIPFYLKIAELVCCIVIWICVGSVPGFPIYGGGGFINFTSTISFVVTTILFLFYLFHKIQKLPGPWILIEVVSIVVSAVLFIISLIVGATATRLYGDSAIASAVFCGVAMIIYLVELFLRFKVMRVEGFRFTAHLKTTETSQPPPSTENQAGGPYIIGA